METISIIVPVYNAGLYLERCIKSIIRNSYRQLELLLVDDGSTDNSAEICADYARIDERITVIKKENGGPASARNLGLLHASGTYVSFVDSDDYIDQDMYQTLMQAVLPEDDMLIFGCEKEYQETGYTECVKEYPAVIKGPDRVGRLVYPRKLLGIWSKLYRLAHIKDEQNQLEIMFCEELTAWEDLLFNVQYVNKTRGMIKSVAITPYHYVIHANSLGRTAFSSRQLQIILVYRKIMEQEALSEQDIIQVKLLYSELLCKTLKKAYTEGADLDVIKRLRIELKEASNGYLSNTLPGRMQKCMVFGMRFLPKIAVRVSTILMKK